MRADSVELAEAASAWSGAYVHVPFCARICPYCDFNVVQGRDDSQHRFVEAVLTQIRMERPWRQLDAVALGGGTPSRVPSADLSRIVGELRALHGIAEGAEVSLEANPEDWTDEYGAVLVEHGFNRASFGAQSFDGAILESLGRLHGPNDIVASLRSARNAGFESINLDLMFGTPGESMASWMRSVHQALALEPEHLSLYALTVERGTELSRKIAAGATAPEEDDQADKYEWAIDVLAAAGYTRYEVSNFARDGHSSRYNLLTWAQGEYLGFGPGGHGHIGGQRYRNIHRLDAYLEAVESGRRPEQGRDVLSPWEREQERLMLGLRRMAGADAGLAGEMLARDDWGRRLFAAGVVSERSGRLHVDKPLLGSEVTRAVLALSCVDC